MAINTADVLVGAPNQLTTGAIHCAALGVAMPTDARTALTSGEKGFKDSGYVSEDGLKITPTYSTSDITDWSGALVRRVLETFTGEMSWTSIQMGEQDLKNAFGDDNVTVTAANGSHGVQKAVKIGARLPKEREWVFEMKDGENLIRVVVPRGQVTNVGEIGFVRNAPIGLETTLSCYADAAGNSLYIYTDDGVFTA
ncbi:MAG: hypothetical protein LBV06_08390 [Propionibacteriaceae bacterium]|jgi:hypothetical protein|nr:hypothetical protein [Propionibacteriaceae bacterium]